MSISTWGVRPVVRYAGYVGYTADLKAREGRAFGAAKRARASLAQEIVRTVLDARPSDTVKVGEVDALALPVSFANRNRVADAASIAASLLADSEVSIIVFDQVKGPANGVPEINRYIYAMRGYESDQRFASALGVLTATEGVSIIYPPEQPRS